MANGKLGLPGVDFDVQLHDVETLNKMATQGVVDITKLSFHAWLLVREKYRLLRVGAALGFGCGPLVVSKHDMPTHEIDRCRVAVPGELTTAHMLFRLWHPEAKNKVFVPYDRIFDLVLKGEVDCGVIIHESRFTYEQFGLQSLADLGAWWENETGLPIPLGCIAVRSSLQNDLVEKIELLLKDSIHASLKNPEKALAYMKEHAQELDENVILKHVETFVNDFSLDLGESGLKAIAALEKMAEDQGLIQ